MTHPMPPSETESYLLDYHRRLAGVTARWFSRTPVTRGDHRFDSTYALLAAEVPSDSREHTVLDLACGDGYLLELLAHREPPRPRLLGLDMSADELAHAQARLQGAATLHQGLAQSLPFEDDSLDVVLSHLALMLMDDCEQVLSEVRRTLKPDGKLSCVVGGGFAPTGSLAVFRELMKPAIESQPRPLLSLGDKRFRSTEGLQQLFGLAFQHVDVFDLLVQDGGSPEHVWDSLAQTYDADQLPPSTREGVRKAFLSAVEPLRDSAGNISCHWSMRQVTAHAPRR
ncbi:class I SAM-dependent methyltransferase [Myxococcus faecalis]|uniref:class I SAM-dependent methyltransferase n=1 Tax=Myxococcus faecalis TaxID=3115646 RepID=UPI003CF99BE5